MRAVAFRLYFTDKVEPETLPNTLQPCNENDRQAQHSLQLKMQEKISTQPGLSINIYQ